MQHQLKQSFLRERLLELFHKDTLDSYRVRIHNSNSLLKELKLILIGWEQKKVQSFDTVRFCGEELISCVKNDDFLDLSSYSKDLLITDLTSLAKSDGKYDIPHLVYILDILLNSNKDVYIHRLFEEIQDVVFTEEDFPVSEFIPVMERIDGVCIKLATELMNIGYSKTYIYRIINKIADMPLAGFNDNFKLFRKLILAKKSIDFVVVFKVVSKNELEEVTLLNELVDEIDKALLTKKVTGTYSSFVASDKYSKFWICPISANDQYVAIKKSKTQLSALFDKIHLGYNGLNFSINSRALVINMNEKNKARLNPVDFMIDGDFASNQDLYSKFNELFANIDKNSTIARDVKDRIYSALRYLRLGNNAVEIEQRFINYWIGLEFLFSFPQKSQHTFSRLKENLVNVLLCCYLKRNLYILKRMLKKEGLITDQEDFWTFSEPDFDSLISKVTSPLLRFHIQKTKSLIFGNSEKRSRYIKKHEDNLNQNLSRIYHLRNELIHEAALKQDIENITSNLRYYLVFVLNQLISYFSKLSVVANVEDRMFNIDDVFYEYKLWKKRIEKDWAFEVIMAVPVEMDLIDKK